MSKFEMMPQVKFAQTLREVVQPLGIPLFLTILLFKILLLGFFSSEYQDLLFTPFVDWFLDEGGNPWKAVNEGGLMAEFPYPPVMLYVLSIFYAPIKFLGLENAFVVNLLHGLPLLIADLAIMLALFKLTQVEARRLGLVYLTSPVILFSIFVHHQLDVIPIALFLVSLCFFIRHHFVIAGVIFGLSLATKLHVLAVLPLLVIYLYKQQLYACFVLFLTASLATLSLLSIPYVLDDGFLNLVLFNEKQKLLFDTFYQVGDVKVFLPIFVSLLLYMAFFSFRKVNRDLLIAFSALLFASTIFFIKPSPGWYVWLVPLISLLSVKSNQKREGSWLLVGLSSVYLLYFLFAHDFEYQPVLFLGDVVVFPSVTGTPYQGLLFTLLEASLCYCVFFVYRVSVRSNAIYKKKKPFMVGVGGDSSTGKSTLQVLMNKLFKDSLLQIEGDGDHKWVRGDTNWKTYTHLNPKANWIHRQAENLYALKNWQEIKRVDYDHKIGHFTDHYALQPKDFVLISALHPFYLPISRTTLDMKVYMDPDESLRRHWKVSRDTAKRGYSIEKVMEQIEARMADARKFIYPQKSYADVIISFFPVEGVPELGNGDSLKLGLDIRLEASIHVESLLDVLRVEVEWDYAEDLCSQTLKIWEEPQGVDYETLVRGMVPNLDELVYEPEFENGYNGLIQLIMLLSISQKMKEEP